MFANVEFRIAYSENVRRVMRNANRLARKLNDDWIGTEHLLQGMLIEQDSDMMRVFTAMKTDVAACHKEIGRLTQPRPARRQQEPLALTPRAKLMLDYAVKWARRLNQAQLQPVDLLVGALCEREGLAAQVLMNVGLELRGVCRYLIDQKRFQP